MPIGSPRLSSVDVAHVVAVDRHGAAVDVVEARDQIGDRRLAGAAGADQRGELPRLDLEGDVVERRALKLGRVAERHIVERHVAAQRRRIER